MSFDEVAFNMIRTNPCKIRIKDIVSFSPLCFNPKDNDSPSVANAHENTGSALSFRIVALDTSGVNSSVNTLVMFNVKYL